MINTLLTLKYSFSFLLFSVLTHRKRFILRILQSTKNISMNNRCGNIYINDGYSFLGLCFTVRSNEFMRCNSYY